MKSKYKFTWNTFLDSTQPCFTESFMSVRILIPTPLRQFTDQNDSVLVEGRTVGELLYYLTEDNPALRRHLFSDEGKIRGFVNVYVNNEDIRFLQIENTPVKESDVISIIPSIAGG
jgi:adenylyltransferase/sulfurtransferase